jgi:hypothetical protein
MINLITQENKIPDLKSGANYKKIKMPAHLVLNILCFFKQFFSYLAVPKLI